MPKVTVIVPVFDPGDTIDELIDSLLGQTMPAADRELVFVDDGCTDGTGERLDALAAAHPDVQTLHIPNSGWPGRPRNVGLGLARGEFVFFADNDDWLARDALERLYDAAIAHRADIVVGKVVGHGRVIPHIFTSDRHGLDASNAPLALLTPHKLFRTAMLREHGIRFPEGKRRLEDHLFVVPAYFAAQRISVLGSHPVYHWVVRGRDGSASRQRPDAAGHFGSIRELLAIVDERTTPGAVRDRYHLHWYRGKVLKRVGRATGHQRDRDYRVELYEHARALVNERFPPSLDKKLAFNFRLRARLIRRDDLAGLERLRAYEASMRARARVVRVRRTQRGLLVRVTGELRAAGEPAVHLVREGGRLLWQPPEALERLWDESERDVTDVLDARLRFVLRSRHDEAEWVLEPRATPGAGRALSLGVVAETEIDPATAAAGRRRCHPAGTTCGSSCPSPASRARLRPSWTAGRSRSTSRATAVSRRRAGRPASRVAGSCASCVGSRPFAAGRRERRGQRGLEVDQVVSRGDHGEALRLLRDVLGEEAVHAGDHARRRAGGADGLERLEHGRVLEPQRGLQAERQREVRRPDVDAVQAGRRRDLGGSLHAPPRLDHHQAQPLRGAAQRAEGPHAVGRVAAGGDRAGGLLAVLDHRDDDAGGAEVERVADRERLVARDAHERGHAGAGDRLEHRGHHRRVDRAVLLVDDDVVGSGQRHRLGGQRRRDRRPQPDRGVAGAQLLAQLSHRSSRRPRWRRR